MSVRRKNDGRWMVEIYDPITRKKHTLTHREIRELGFDPPANERQGKAIERAALNARDQRRPGHRDETCDAFTGRWTVDFARPAEATNVHNAERASLFGEEFKGRPMRTVTRTEARKWAKENPSRLPAVRAMFSDALDDRLVDENMFARLGHKNNTGREDITVLTRNEVETLARLAERVHGGDFGLEAGAMIEWAAYTMMRPGEVSAARHSLLDGDTYHLRRQFNSTVRRETAPKHNSSGTIYVPDPALDAIRRKPRRMGDDLIFRTARGRQFRQESIHRMWVPIRAAFTETVAETHHLRLRLEEDPKDFLDFYELRHFGASYMLNELEIEPWVIAEQLRHTDGGVLVVQLYGHPSRSKAIEIMRRAHGGNVTSLQERSGADRSAPRRASGASRGRG